MLHWLQLVGWLACVVYSTIPAFLLMIHPFVERWSASHLFDQRSPYTILVPVWIAMWVVVALSTRPWSNLLLYSSNWRSNWAWTAAALLFVCGLYVYWLSAKNFSAKQLAGLPEVHG